MIFTAEKNENRKPIGEDEIAQAYAELERYRRGKRNLDARITEDELWWELRHWEVIRKEAGGKRKPFAPSPEPSSAWLFNAILNKHADAMDNIPEPVVLPREQSDEHSAAILTSVLPVLFESCGFEQTYSSAWWEKLKHGTAAYGVFWNGEKENGLGDVDIREIDLLKLFWEPGITDIQSSKNLFIVELQDTDELEARFPGHEGKLGASPLDAKLYAFDESVDTAGKSVVVDWYYKRRTPEGRTVVHFAKFVGRELLYASENEENYVNRGYYDHGLYPVVLDCLFPEKGTPVGFGYVAICKDPQLYIDTLSANILESSMMGTKKRFFISTSTGVNEEEFADWSRPLVHVEGELDDRRIREIVCQPVSESYLHVMRMKIDELKDTAANRDVNTGGVTGGVTAASAIAALQEAGNKTSRDMIAASYRAMKKISALCIELIRQFYDVSRTFRITGDTAAGHWRFESVSAAMLRETIDGVSVRRPVFDLKIKVQKKSPFSRMELNERAKELYRLGFFDVRRASEALGALEMMDFEGIEEVRNGIIARAGEHEAQERMKLGAVMSVTGSGREEPAAGENTIAGRVMRVLGRDGDHIPQLARMGRRDG